jgi:hypothetical protein
MTDAVGARRRLFKPFRKSECEFEIGASGRGLDGDQKDCRHKNKILKQCIARDSGSSCEGQTRERDHFVAAQLNVIPRVKGMIISQLSTPLATTKYLR